MPTYNPILQKLRAAVNHVMRIIPASEKSLVDRIENKLTSLDLSADGTIKTTAKNLSLINTIQNEINSIAHNPKYQSAVKEYTKQFTEVGKLQNEYWKAQEAKFKPPRILKQLKGQAIDDVLSKLVGDGYRANVTDSIRDVMRRNITTGGSYADLTKQLRDMIRNTKTPGILSRYVRQVTTDAINQYSAQFNQLTSSDLGYKWFSYDGTDIITTRPFCDAMTNQPYFHISEIPRILRADGLTYVDKNGATVPVPINAKTNLPHGMIPGTNAANFLINRGGYNCGHQIRPISEDQVPIEVRAKIMASPSYKAWASNRGEQLSMFDDKRLEKFTVGYAPFREGDISDILKAGPAFDNKKFIEWRKLGNELADDLGITILDDNNSVGIYAATSNNAEASRVLTIEADPELAELYAAMMGTLAPDVQNSVMLNKYSDTGEQVEYYIKFDSKQDAVAFVNNRRNYGIEDVSLLYDDNKVLVIDFGGFEKNKLTTDYGQKVEIEERKVQTRFIGEDEYGKIMSKARDTLSKHDSEVFGEALNDFLTVSEARLGGKPLRLENLSDTEFKSVVTALMKSQQDSFNNYRGLNSSGPATVERQKLYDSIIEKATSAPSTKKNTIYSLGGAPANGKSTLLESGFLPFDKKTTIINPDEFKFDLPEWDRFIELEDNRGASFLHEESSMLSKQAVNKMLEDGKDFILDAVGGGDYESMSKKITRYKQGGKNWVRGDYVTLDTDLSIKLEAARAKAGRKVPLDYLLQKNREVAELWPKLAKGNVFDELYLWDTNLRGKPRLIAEAKNGTIKIHDRKLYNNFLNKAK